MLFRSSSCCVEKERKWGISKAGEGGGATPLHHHHNKRQTQTTTLHLVFLTTPTPFFLLITTTLNNHLPFTTRKLSPSGMMSISRRTLFEWSLINTTLTIFLSLSPLIPLLLDGIPQFLCFYFLVLTMDMDTNKN